MCDCPADPQDPTRRHLLSQASPLSCAERTPHSPFLPPLQNKIGLAPRGLLNAYATSPALEYISCIGISDSHTFFSSSPKAFSMVRTGSVAEGHGAPSETSGRFPTSTAQRDVVLYKATPMHRPSPTAHLLQISTSCSE